MDCVDALLRVGFARDDGGAIEGEMIVARGDRRVAVPDLPILPAETVRALVHAAGISYDEFLEALAEMPTDPGVPSVTRARGAAA